MGSPNNQLFSFRQRASRVGPLHAKIGLIATDRIVEDSEHQAPNRLVELVPV